MTKNDKVQFFLELFFYWCGKLDLPFKIKTEQDLELDAPACILDEGGDYLKESEIILMYNPKIIKKQYKYILINMVLHEIGHLIFFLPYEKKMDQIEAEYLAELFSLCLMKIHYKKEYLKCCNYFVKYNVLEAMKKSSPLHYKAYKKIKEYKIGG